MKKRLALTTVLTVPVLLLAACGGDDEPTGSEPTEPTTSQEPTDSPSTEPTAEPTDTPDVPDTGAAELVGDWSDEAGEWVVHFEDDGTFTLDVDGVETTSGSYSRDGDTVLLTGADGNDQTGRIVGEDLVFDFGTLVRQVS